MTKYVITNPISPELDINSQEDANDYNFKVSKLYEKDRNNELNAVLAAKHNLKTLHWDSSGNDNMKMSMCLNDKVLIILGHLFGHDTVQNFSGGTKGFFDLVSDIDFKISKLQLDPEQHASEFLREMGSYLNQKP
jgi:hypothetical protein